MNQLLDQLLNLGVPETASPYVRRRIRFANGLKLLVLTLYMLYFLLGLASAPMFCHYIKKDFGKFKKQSPPQLYLIESFNRLFT